MGWGEITSYGSQKYGYKLHMGERCLSLSDIHDIVQCMTSVMLELLFDTVYNYKLLRGLKFSLPSWIGAGA